ncbi:MAG: hypothetical protein K2J95_07350 [Lachnospiraceae bacterium]|nr:hypothetical protein [Lachnospiraceae bacterium]
MINGVNNNNINSYRNHSVRPSKTNMDAPPFLLQYDEKGVVWDRKEQDDQENEKKVQEAEENRKKAADVKSATAKALSVNDAPPAMKDTSKVEGQAGEDLFRGILNGVKNFFVGIFNFIWYGDEGKAEQTQKEERIKVQAGDSVGTEPVTSAVAAASTGEGEQIDKDALIKELIARHDTKGVVDILTENHTIQPARNSTLLTYYNRHGKIVELHQTNTGRILHGDRHTRSL